MMAQRKMRLNDGAEKDEARGQVEGLLPDAGCKDGSDTLQVIVVIAFQAAGKIVPAGRVRSR
jgi:hypothetical protein